RWRSTRFPGKPLHSINGVSMLARTAEVARRAGAANGARVVVATDDDRIMAHAAEIGVDAVLTDPALPSGTDRALAAANFVAPDADFIVNLQGDAPFTPASHLSALIGFAGRADVVTPVVQLSWNALDALRARKLVTPFSGTTCIRGDDGRAIWFSKTILPAIRDEARRRTLGEASPVLQHIGLYGYSRDALEKISALTVSRYEEIEGLEQLRFLENGLSVHAVEVTAPDLGISGIDTPEDARLAEDLIARHGDPHTAAY
ncbi:MAG: 3-deoxy-manno-octulosonate cytidylyltransferase, partial [Alphaproteobacteria bacterium]|nr:3-deoxy-manno-octulosonate cytidylyltransferase [Alphaproteobacteria bacterium]